MTGGSSPKGARLLLAALAAFAPLVVPSPVAGQEPDAPAGPGVEAAAWLQGCWRAETGAVVWEEQWMAPAGGIMVGMTRTLRPGREAGWEHLLLRRRHGVLTYSALPSGQALTHFSLVRAEEDGLRFENPDHDFPQAIEYRRLASGTVHAHVYGGVGDTEPAFVVPYHRKACPGPA